MGKRIAVGVIIFAVVLVAVFLIFDRDRLIEQWQINKLRSGDERAKAEALSELVSRRSISAVPHLGKLVEAGGDLDAEALDGLIAIREPAFGELLRLLEVTTGDQQQSVSQQIALLEPPLEGITKLLIKKIDESHSEGSVYTLYRLLSRQFELDAQSAMGFCLQLLQLKNFALREKAAQYIAGIGLDEKIAIEFAQAAIVNDAPAVREVAVRILGTYRDPAAISSLTVAMDDESSQVRRLAVIAIGSYPSVINREEMGATPGTSAPGPTGDLVRKMQPAINKLLSALDDKDSSVRVNAAIAIRTHAGERVLFRALHSAKPRVAKAVLAALEGSKDPTLAMEYGAILDRLARKEKLNAGQRDMLMSVLQALSSKGGQISDAIPSILKFVKHPDQGVRFAVLDALGNGGTSAQSALEVFIELLKDEDIGVRQRAAVAIGSVGKHAEVAIPALVEALDDPEVMGWAADSLGAIGEASLPTIRKLLKEESAEKRLAALEAVLKMQDLAQRELASEIVGLLSDETLDVRAAAMRAATTLNLEGEEVQAGLAKLLSDESLAMRFEAARFLTKAGGDLTLKAVNVLKDVVLSKDIVEGDRLTALDELEGAGPVAVDALRSILGVEIADLRVTAVQILGKFGPAAKPALEDLRKLEATADETLKVLVRESIQAIEATEASE
ncbi:MAG: HEAT repeat domain-containing protein [Planctomycetota bacterium]